MHYTGFRVSIEKIVLILISWLLQKPTDQDYIFLSDLHCFPKRMVLVSAGPWLTFVCLFVMMLNILVNNFLVKLGCFPDF